MIVCKLHSLLFRTGYIGYRICGYVLNSIQKRESLTIKFVAM